MPRYEYKVVPAPTKGLKPKGVKTPEGRFAAGVEAVLNEMGAQGWEYLRAELLPSDERSGLTGTAVHWRNVLVFRRALAGLDQVADPVPTVEATAEPSVHPTLGPAPDRSAPAAVPERRDPPRLSVGPAAGADAGKTDEGGAATSPEFDRTAALRWRVALGKTEKPEPGNSESD